MPEVLVGILSSCRGNCLPYNGRLLLTRSLRIVRSAGQKTTDFRDERLRIARLHHHCIEAGRAREIELLDLRITGGGNQRNRTRIRARFEVTRDLEPGLSWKLEIHHDQVGFPAHGFGVRALAVGGGQDIETFGSQVQSPHIERVGIIIDDQETW